MTFNKKETIIHELKHHWKLTLSLSFLAGVLVAIFFNLENMKTFVISSFEILHPLHVFVSAIATSTIYYKYKKSVINSLIIGTLGAIIIGTLSDILLPWIAGNLLTLHTHFHLPLIEEPFLIISSAVIGSLFGIHFKTFKTAHSLHVFLSVFASLFYLVAYSQVLNPLVIIALSIIVFLAVYIPCCISDIIFPIMFIRKPCDDCGYWHEGHKE
jgi:hypothetical protein